MADVFEQLAALSDPARVRLLAVLANGELSVGEIAHVLQVPQSTASRHVKALETAGWVERRASGTTSLLRFANAPGDQATRLWQAVSEPVTETARHQEDLDRVTAVLAARTPDQGYFGRVSAGWDQVRRDLFGDGFMLPTALSLVDANLVIGDLGCGTGHVVAAIAPSVTRVIGIDQEQVMLDVARARTAEYDNVELRPGGLSALPLEDDTLDAALCMLVLHHVADLKAAFHEIARVLHPGCRLVALDMRAHDRQEYRAAMGHVHLGFDRADLEGPARAAGLRLERWTDLPPQPGAQGPPLFLAVFRTQST